MNNLKIRNINNAKVEAIYTSIYIIKNDFKILKNGTKDNDTFYTIIGTDLKNKKHILYMTHSKNNDLRSWLNIFEILKGKGIKEILFLTSLEDKNIKKTLRISYPNTKFTTSLIELSEYFYRFTPERNNRCIYIKLRRLHLAKTIEDYKEENKRFDDYFNNNIQIKLKEKYLKNVEAIYKIPYEFRLLIYGCYSNLEYYNKLRIFFDTIIFNNLDDLYEKLEENVIDDKAISVFSKRDWTSILSEIMVQYPEIKII